MELRGAKPRIRQGGAPRFESLVRQGRVRLICKSQEYARVERMGCPAECIRCNCCDDNLDVDLLQNRVSKRALLPFSAPSLSMIAKSADHSRIWLWLRRS